ncbi:protein ENHANCED DOWNY MILDEW 2 [Phalaenopsis equestris]|uniref:protein ENHANCED DOWNY MILDEW 2 n=1 Tax=Phalaenopsis equestris TaxID=78828 RepID=UPI0009E28C88|nr:protein ENHANCED DOWNY MILDEW 2 [Phalaenopsis equestris]XP_020593201.1 protein ENHANCED DOWNY MILDEW 2 [Phalaenopsis equestris]
MASSDDEEVVVTQSITNYHFVDKDGVPISFSTLPIIMDDEKAKDPIHEVSVRGTMDGGLQSVFKDVVAWRLRLEGDGPEIFVLSKDTKWIKLEKPKKSYEESIRTTLITIHLLHFSKNNPEASVKSFWEHLRQALNSFDDRPSEDEFEKNIQLIKLFMERDEGLAKSQILLTFLENPKKVFVEDFHNSLEEKPFIIDDELEDGIGIDDGEESEEESDLFDSVCAICDNGGELLCCEGRCLRSFHATRRAGEDSDCASLGLTRFQVEAMQNFLCKNCQLKQHQCFACGKLGSSDKSGNPEVFCCVSATCGRFYHPKCVADLLFPENKVEATELGKRIAGGESFTCTVHRCIVCKQVENKEVEELQFAICRRCPKAYHRKCLPRKIAFEDDEDEDIIQRAWEGLLPNRILIYCLKHEIDEELGTPYRDHIVFPELHEKKRETDVQKPKPKKSLVASARIPGDLKFSKFAKRFEKVPVTDSDDSMSTGGKVFTQKVLDSKWEIPKNDAKSAVKRLESTELMEFGSTKFAKPILDGDKALTAKAKVSKSAVAVHGKLINTAPKILPEIRKDILSLVEEESSSLTQDDIRKMLSRPSTYGSSAGQIDKSITLGKIEGAIEAVRTALEKLEGGGNVEDAKAVCEPEILKRLIKWNVKLKVYLAPVLHGARYSSYGRHFTKFDKLQEIVDKLQWYVQEGDMIVDFCCGANEFSILMKEKLDSTSKKCSFKNYDILQAKNDFNFEMRDWMTVRPDELPTGSRLIMGLNPPFGLNARLANQFIDKALTFKPKLLILIVPEETRRLDQKNPQYDLIWEDRATLSGKSFYLPGSIDVHDKQIEQWNVKPPVLYLWSRPDWTSKHKSIASIQGHTSTLLPSLVHKDSQTNSGEEASIANRTTEEKHKKDANQGDKESMPLKQKGHASSEPASGFEAQIQAERNEESPEQQEAGSKKKQIQERPKKREAGSVQKEESSGREVPNKQQRSEERPEKKSAVPGGKDDKPDPGKKNSEQSKKRKSSESRKDNSEMSKEEQKHPKKVKGGNSSEHGVSISPPDRREPADLSVTKSGAFEVPFDRGTSHGAYSGSGIEMRNISSVGRPSSIHDDPDLIPRRYNSAERDSFYMNSPHGPSVTEAYTDERLRGYNTIDPFNPNPYARNGYGRPDSDSRTQSRTYGLQSDEVSNSYGRSSDTDSRPQFGSYSLHAEEVRNGYGRPIEPEGRTQIRSYGLTDDADLGNRYSLGGSGSQSLGQPSLYPSSSYRFLSPSPEASAMQRYAPQLDEMNHLRAQPMSPGIPFPSRVNIPPDSFGFAPGAASSYPNHRSFGGGGGGVGGGWIDN